MQITVSSVSLIFPKDFQLDIVTITLPERQWHIIYFHYDGYYKEQISTQNF
jgi:hypothetical protein